MRPDRPTPVNRARPFEIDELFLSTTDARGIIRMSNDVFVRISGYTREELVGTAHNVIRHPDMPRAVFRLMWDYLEAERPIAAYVKNMAADGAHYWVMATVMPVDGGYLSVRLKPSSPLFDAAQAIYAELLALEQAIEGDDPSRRKAAIEESGRRLGELLEAAGYEDYDAFMRAALPAEVEHREAMLQARAAESPVADLEPALRDALEASAQTHRFLLRLSESLGDYTASGETLARKSDFVLDLADQVRLFALNAILAADRLRDGAALGAVADLMRARSTAVGPLLEALSGEIVEAGRLLRDVGFRMATAKLQTEMMGVFIHELAAGARQDDVAHQLTLLTHSVEEAVTLVSTALATVDGKLATVRAHAAGLMRELAMLRALEVNGRVESARVPDAQDIQLLFSTIGEQVAEARAELEEFAAIGTRGEEQNRAVEREAQACVASVRAAVAAL